jgi:hypothetical protein
LSTDVQATNSGLINPLYFWGNKMTIVDKRKWQLSECGEYEELAPECLGEYYIALDKQSDLWLEGESTHNEYSGECTPDMSCCGNEIWDIHKRIKFLESDDKKQINMLMSGWHKMTAKHLL